MAQFAVNFPSQRITGRETRTERRRPTTNKWRPTESLQLMVFIAFTPWLPLKSATLWAGLVVYQAGLGWLGSSRRSNTCSYANTPQAADQAQPTMDYGLGTMDSGLRTPHSTAPTRCLVRSRGRKCKVNAQHKVCQAPPLVNWWMEQGGVACGRRGQPQLRVQPKEQLTSRTIYQPAKLLWHRFGWRKVWLNHMTEKDEVDRKEE